MNPWDIEGPATRTNNDSTANPVIDVRNTGITNTNNPCGSVWIGWIFLSKVVAIIYECTPEGCAKDAIARVEFVKIVQVATSAAPREPGCKQTEVSAGQTPAAAHPSHTRKALL